MQMTFYNSVHVTLWFDAWTSSNLQQYILILSGLVMFSIAHEALSAYRAARVTALLLSSPAVTEDVNTPLIPGDHPSSSNSSSRGPSGSPGVTGARSHQRRRLSLHYKALLGALYAFQLLTAYLLMLAVMTYNVGCCLAVVLGLGVGYVIFFDQSSINHLARGEACHLTDEE